MQFFEPLVADFSITAFGSLTPYHEHFAFPVVKLPSPMDLPNFPFKMQILNRLFVDAHYLFGLEEKLSGLPAGRQGFDLVHSAETYFHYTQQALMAKRKGYVKKVIATVLENIPFNNEGIWGRKTFKKRAREELDHIIALTQKTKDALLAEGADPKKITVISHFVDTKRFYPRRFPELKKSQFRESAQQSHRLTILFVGRLEEYKGVFDILTAARVLLRDRDLSKYSLQFLFVGDGSEKEKMERAERALGIEKFVSHRSATYEHMPEVYRSADIFVAPSKPRTIRMVRGKPHVTWEEQYNTAILEAQASGLPIVTTRTGGVPENVGEAAILVETGDVLALAQAIKRFVIDSRLRAHFGQLARKRALTVHDIAVGAKKLKELYQNVLAGQ